MSTPTSDPTRYWQELVAAALLGTERQAPPAPAAGPLGELVGQLNTQDRERALLGAAAAVALYRRVGRQPALDSSPLPEPCEPDERPRCSGRAAQRLEQMLRGQFKECLPEWLAAAAAAGLRAPEECLPELLEQGRHQSALQEAVLPVLGRRGEWLAAQNPAWSWVAGSDSEAVWETGSREARVVLLRRLRRQAPERARELVAATWAEESPEDRARFLTFFRHGLSMADEPFLEETLDDRRKEVRRLAADLLASLPGSQLCRRITDRARPLLSVSRKLLAHSLAVTLPDACDAAMVRDGIEPKPPSAGPKMGEKAWWLLQMLKAVPLGVWSEALGRPPEQAVALAKQSEWSAVLLEGWTWAAVRQQDNAWAAALLPEAIRQPWSDVQAFYDALPPEWLETVLARLVQEQQGRLDGDAAHGLFWALQASREPWSPSLSRVMLEALESTVRAGKAGRAWELQGALPRLAACLDPSLAPRATVLLTEKAKAESDWAKPIDQFLALLQFRHDMLKELTG